MEPAQPATRWTVHAATADNDDELLVLFQQVFNTAMPIAQWRWKYAQAPVRGMMLRRGARAVAFFGGMPRPVQGPAGPLVAVQNGDVMVLPGERGVFSRRGALHHVAAAFFGELVGPAKQYEFAFGFPNERHFRLGLKLGLYDAAGRMTLLTWSPMAARPPWSIEQMPLAGTHLERLAPLCAAMHSDWPLHHIPVRDAARWRTRFVTHPTHRYEILQLRRRVTGNSICAFVLREHEGHVEWLDYAGPAAAAPHAVAAARGFAQRCGGKPLTAMFSDTIAPAFAAGAATCQPSDIHIPVNARPPGENRPYLGRMWLMGGDTDFL